jgi:hypothetical protein
MRRVAIALVVAAAAQPAGASGAVRWSVGTSYRVHLPRSPSAHSATTRRELGELRALQRRRTSSVMARLQPWRPRAAVTSWARVTVEEIRAHSMNPVRAARALALVSVAMNDAIQTLHSSLATPARPSPCRLDAQVHPVGGCSALAAPVEAAAAGQAASLVLAYLFPDRRPAVGRVTTRALSWPLWSATAYRSDVEAATQVGRRVAGRVIARAREDGSAAQWSGIRPTGPGLWQPTPPAFGPPAEPVAGTWRTWNLDRGAQFRPAPPPDPGSAAFDAEAQQVYDTTRALTEQQRRLAAFWADVPGTVTPPGHWNAIALAMIRARALGPERAALVLATLNTAQADGFIACWDAKYAYWSVRPVTVIQQWWYDAGWSPLLVTPPFPSFVSGHATTSAAAAAVLGSFFAAERARLRRMADEAAQSRLYAGIHFPSDTLAGLALGRKVAGVALRRISQSSQQRR